MTAIVLHPDDAIIALTLWQPWASLIAEGVKTIETRSWKAPDDLIGDTIAIHAAARKPPAGLRLGPQTSVVAQEFLVSRDGRLLADLCNEEMIPLHLGAIVATARLVDCLPMIGDEDMRPDEGEYVVLDGYGHARIGPHLHDLSDQVPYGDFAPGRWAWLLDDIAKVEDRCPWCGGDCHEPLAEMGELCRLCSHVGTDYHERGRVAGPIPAKGRQRLWRWSPPDNGHAETPGSAHQNGSSGADA